MRKITFRKALTDAQVEHIAARYDDEVDAITNAIIERGAYYLHLGGHARIVRENGEFVLKSAQETRLVFLMLGMSLVL